MEPSDWQVKEKKRRISLWLISTIVIALLLIISVFTDGFGIGGITGATTVDVEETVRAYVEENLVEPGTLVEVSNIENENDLYKVTINIDGQEFDSYVSKDGKLLFPTVIDMTESIPDFENIPIQDVQLKKVEGSTFEETGDGICKDERGKPYVLLFSTTWCPHCEWIKDTFDGLVNEDFVNKVNIQHWEIDIGDNTLTDKVENEVPKNLMAFYDKYNPKGSIPTYVFGCKYVRIGNGYESEDDLNAELNDFKLIINKLV